MGRRSLDSFKMSKSDSDRVAEENGEERIIKRGTDKGTERKTEAYGSYEEYLDNLKHYEQAEKEKEESNQIFSNCSKNVEKNEKRLEDLLQEKSKLEEMYNEKRIEAPLNFRRNWEERVEQQRQWIEQMQQEEIEQAERESYDRRQKNIALLSELERELDDQNRRYNQLTKEQADKKTVVPEEMARELEACRSTVKSLSGKRKYMGKPDGEKLRKAIRLPELIVGLVLLNLMLFITCRTAVTWNSSGLVLIQFALFALGLIGVPINFFFAKSPSGDYVVFGLELLLIYKVLSLSLTGVMGDIAINVFTVCGMTLLIKTAVLEPILVKRLNTMTLKDSRQRMELLTSRMNFMKEGQMRERGREIDELQLKIRDGKRRKEKLEEDERTENRAAALRRNEIWERWENKKRDIPSMPDIYDDNNFLEKDRRSLEELARRRNELFYPIEKRNRELEDSRKQMAEAQRKCGNAEEKMKEYGGKLRAWLSDENGTTLEVNDKTVLFCDKICIRNYEDPEGGLPQIIRHNKHPMIFKYNYYGSDWKEEDQEGAVNLISEIWRGFAKMVPPDLLDFYVVDPSKLVNVKIGDPDERRKGFVKIYRKSYFDKKNNCIVVRGGNDPDKKKIAQYVKGVFEEGIIKVLDQEIEKKQDEIQEDLRDNDKKVTEAVEKYKEENKEAGSSFTQIQRANLKRDNDGKRAYHIVFMVVPRESQNLEMPVMYNLLKGHSCADLGVIPIFLVSERIEERKKEERKEEERKEENGKSWEKLVALAEADNGVVYQTDLRKMSLLRLRDREDGFIA